MRAFTRRLPSLRVDLLVKPLCLTVGSGERHTAVHGNDRQGQRLCRSPSRGGVASKTGRTRTRVRRGGSPVLHLPGNDRQNHGHEPDEPLENSAEADRNRLREEPVVGQLPRDPRLSCRTPSSFRVAFAHGAPFWCKPMMRLFLWTLVVPLLIVPFSCGQISSGTCSPQNCSGCCSTSGQCQTLTTSEACGAQGASCVACTLGASCQSGVCINAPVGGSGVSFGGGSAGGGSLGGGTGGGTSTCRPQTCAGLGKNCGEVGDGCGGQLMCGRCEVAGESCGANGTANVCSQGTCTPRSCSSLQKNCGQVSDGCGAQLNCGTCSGTDVCTSNVCTPMTCTPLTCQQLGKNCGSISDGCNRQLNCGTCTVSSETCGGAGMVNVCGRPACTPQTCSSLNKNCGAVDDGCGTALNCGACSGTCRRSHLLT